MIKSSGILPFMLFAGLAVTGCSDKKSVTTEATMAGKTSDSVIINTETRLLLKDLVDNGDYVNTREFPSLIKASVVKEKLDSKMLIIDLRSAGSFSTGHIKGAVNKRFEDIPTYFEKDIKPFEFDKIVLVCDDGQTSSYTASLLRLMGYGNVFAMRWGMSSWNNQIAEKVWLRGLSAAYESKLDTLTHEKPAATGMPELKTGLSSPADISSARFRSVFAEGTDSVLITSDEVFANPEKYYIINYERKDKYDDGHIPGAVRYKPGGTLSFIGEMSTIPTDKTVVVYCGTGHNSGFATAYLRLLGYDARTLKYGNNGFMHNWMVKDKKSLSWLPFSEADVNHFDLVK